MKKAERMVGVGYLWLEKQSETEFSPIHDLTSILKGIVVHGGKIVKQRMNCQDKKKPAKPSVKMNITKHKDHSYLFHNKLP